MLKNLESICKQYSSFLLIGHTKPDADCIGALVSMGIYLESLGKRVFLFTLDAPGEVYNFLPLVNKIKDNLPGISEFECIIYVDNSGEQSGLLEMYPEFYFNFDPIVVVDHHPYKENPSHFNFKFTNYSSTSEIVFWFFREVGFEINQDMAFNLMSGIYYDTNAFFNDNTGYNTLKASSVLLRILGRHPVEIYNFLNKKSLGKLHSFGRALSRLTMSKHFSLIYTYLLETDFSDLKDVSTSSISNFIQGIDESPVTLLLSDRGDGFVRGSLRTMNSLDVRKIAQIISPEGGGHKKAAGFSIPGRLEENNNKIYYCSK
jgi:bifunctional oligoribonuclease and PAP phosphatase NrnA